MGELYEPFPRLPKNIRQIGERDQILRLYLEDYVNTYLKRLQPARGADLRVGLLLGSRETHEDMPFVFVDGALEMDSVTEEGEKVVFTEDAWKKAYQDVERMFPKRTVQGWFLCGGPGCTLSPLNYWRQHSQYFTGKNQLMFLNCGLEGEEAIYITSSDGFYKLRGYSVYYERNQMMQDYMISRRDMPKVESGVDDKVIQDFKQKMDERRYEAGRHKSTVGVLSGVCSVLAVAVLAGGVAMFNNYQKMHQMESVIASAMQDGNVKGILASAGKNMTEDASGKGWSAADKPDYVIEEAAGKVYPTTAPASENAKEQPSQVTPETMPRTDNTESGASRDAASGAGVTDGSQNQGETAGGSGNSQASNSGTSQGSISQTTAGNKDPAALSGNGGENKNTPALSGDGGENKNTSALSGDGGENKSTSALSGDGGENKSPQASGGGNGETGGGQTSGQGQSGQPSAGSGTEVSKETAPSTGGEDSMSESVSAVNYSVYTVGDGETLYGICFKLYHNLQHLDEICRVNSLTDQNSIFSGQKLLVP